MTSNQPTLRLLLLIVDDQRQHKANYTVAASLTKAIVSLRLQLPTDRIWQC